VESEADLSFAGLHALLTPDRRVRDAIDGLPVSQAEALRSVIGIGPPRSQEPVVVGGALLGILSAVSEIAPLLVLLDDVHWLDHASARAIAFAIRRLRFDRIVVVASERDDRTSALAQVGLDTVALAGLDRAATASVVLDIAPGASSTLIERVHDQTGGNPLAVVEISRGIVRRGVSGDGAELRLSPGEPLIRSFGQRIATLPASTRNALVVAAASDRGTIEAVLRAIAALGLDRSHLLPAMDAGLITFRDVIAFSHPLVRSAAYLGAAPSDRRRAHALLAEALAGAPQPDPMLDGERVWHRARAIAGPDEEVAADLERWAELERGRGGYAAASAALERAATTSATSGTAARRRYLAAECAWLSGETARALALLDQAARESVGAADDDPVPFRIAALRGHIIHLTDSGPHAGRMLMDAVTMAGVTDRPRAVTALVDATEAFLWAGDGPAALEAATELAATADRAYVSEAFFSDLLLGSARSFNGAPDRKLLERAVAAVATQDALRCEPLYLVWAAWAARACLWGPTSLELMARAVTRAQSEGIVSALPRALEFMAWRSFEIGAWTEAAAAAQQAVDRARELGQAPVLCIALGTLAMIAAGRGDVDGCRLAADEAIGIGQTRGLAIWVAHASEARGLLALGLDRPAEAVSEFSRASGRDDPRCVSVRGTPHTNYTEALLRAGRPISPELRAFWIRAHPPVVPLEGVNHGRIAALLDPPRATEHLAVALEQAPEAANPFAEARTRLVFGEVLRREGRKVEAREQLRSAIDVFDRLGAAPWSSRARRELRATGVTVRRRDPSPAERLTPQELQIALQVAQGKTNRDVAAVLFLSPKTVEFHLTHVYAKLGVNSRAELVRLFARSGAQMGAAAEPEPVLVT
jgi:DNA-binding CsgD family transcriptional regulator